MTSMRYGDPVPPPEARGVIQDDHWSINYPEIPALLVEIDTFFSKENREDFCVAVRAENSIPAVLVILYLLSKKINFFLAPASARSVAPPPSFCDTLLTVGKDIAAAADLVKSLSLTPNPDYVPGNRTIGVRTGAILFSTSGSSGTVKYVHYTAAQLIRNGENGRRRFHIEAHSRVLIPVPVSHMYGMGVGLLPALIAGANLTLTTKSNVIKLFQQMADFKPSLTLINPTLIRMILTLDKKLPGENAFVTAGETIDRQTHCRFESRYGPLINLYGCTELGAIATSSKKRPPHSACSNGQLLSALPNVTVMIRGGGTGELFCRHNAGFQGYLDKYGVSLTNRHKNSWHRLRDIGMQAGNNRFKITGRKDNCINRAGYLISLEEIEQTLRQLLPDLSQVVVLEIPRPSEPISSLIAVCEITAGVAFDSEVIRSLCKTRLNRYFIPDLFHPISEIPKLNSGKPDRITLKKAFAQ